MRPVTVGRDGGLVRAAVGALLASLVGVAAGAAVTFADVVLEWRLPGNIELAQAMTGALLSALVTLAVFAIWMRSVVAGLAASHVSPRIIASYLADGFQGRLLAGMCAAITFLATVLLGLREELGEGVPALSVSAALAVVIGGLIAVVAALHQGVRQVSPPSVLYRIANHARDLMTADLDPDDDPVTLLPEVGSEPEGSVTSTAMGWVGAVDHAAVLRSLPPATRLRLLVDTGSFVDRGEPIAVADRSLPPATVTAIRASLDVRAWRSLEVDVGYALQQLRDLALQGLQGSVHDSATTDDALRYLGVVMRDLVARREPSGVLVGSQERMLVAVGRQRSSDHVRDVLEPLVHAVADHPSTRVRFLGLLRSLRSAADGPSSAAATPLRARLEQLIEQLETTGTTHDR